MNRIEPSTEVTPETIPEPPLQPVTDEKEVSAEGEPEKVPLDESQTETQSFGEKLPEDNTVTKQQEDSIEKQNRPSEEELNVTFVVGDEEGVEEGGKDESEDIVEVKSKPKRLVYH